MLAQAPAPAPGLDMSVEGDSFPESLKNPSGCVSVNDGIDHAHSYFGGFLELVGLTDNLTNFRGTIFIPTEEALFSTLMSVLEDPENPTEEEMRVLRGIA